MRVKDGYQRKIKFSVSFLPETYERVRSICKQKKMHLSNFVENAVLASLDEREGLRLPARPLMRSTKNFKSSQLKKQNVSMLTRKPRKKETR